MLRRAERPTCEADGRAKNAKMMKEKGSEGLKNGPLQVAFLAACPPSLRTDTLVVGAQRHMRSFDNLRQSSVLCSEVSAGNEAAERGACHGSRKGDESTLDVSAETRIKVLPGPCAGTHQ